MEDMGVCMALFLQHITVTYLIVIIGPGMAHIYERKVANGDCDLVLTCGFRQVPARSKVECAVFAMSPEDIGFYYNPSTGICNICKLGPSATTDFTKINIDRGYFSESKWKFIIVEHTDAETKWSPFCRRPFQMYFHAWMLLYFDSPKFVHKELQWRHNQRDGDSNHQPHDCLLNHSFRRKSKKISKLRVTGLCEGNSPVTGEFPAQRASNAENVSIWWRHHGTNCRLSNLTSNSGQ